MDFLLHVAHWSKKLFLSLGSSNSLKSFIYLCLTGLGAESLKFSWGQYEASLSHIKTRATWGSSGPELSHHLPLQLPHLAILTSMGLVDE